MGIKPEDQQESKDETQTTISDPPLKKNKYKLKKIGPVEEEIIDDMFKELSSIEEDKIIKRAKKGESIKGSKS